MVEGQEGTKRCFWVAECFKDGKYNIVGCVAGEISDEFDDDTVELKKMSVDEKYQRKGIATKLCNTIENWSRSIGRYKVALSTVNKMDKAVALY